MPNRNYEECRNELHRLGWSVTLSQDASTWKLKAVRGQETWMYYAVDVQDVWDAVMEMARRHTSHTAQPHIN